ncbi:hypothetical protein GL50803_002341 [Giardia duodenalis]|uniref:Uncharacterized protein n=1 Tax=Giardia intestinalis (strain ATCC 50803 / WB clone C6) TaxID=184922 RepID=A8BHD0_GIAIC|nr:hypothetical protein GL50803_002341 [Giardia intestinalis]KAE8301664.1 hypothetical protein GL50803_002341 [Giardia intestinalis]|eukprot:XP_001707084.1 Hypothetical protein GL50803_2341 [Giardia lamblia ATCC 50803]
MGERIRVFDKAADTLEADMVVFEHAGVSYVFRVDMDVADNVDALSHEYNILRTRPTAAEVDAEIKRLEKQAKQRKPRSSSGNSELELKVSRLREVCTMLAGALAERKGVEVGRIYQLFNITSL